MLGFELSEEEQLLKESVDRFVERECSFAQRREVLRSDVGFDRERWGQFAELGWLGLTFPESAGGFGAGARSSSLLMEALGRALATEPYLPCVIMAGGVLSLAQASAHARELLGKIAAGEIFASLAYAEPASRYDLNTVHTSATSTGGRTVLNGHKSIVLNGDCADVFVVSARTSGTPHAIEGISLFAVDARLPGVKVRGYPTNDGGRAAEVWFDNVEIDSGCLLGEEDRGFSMLELTIERATAAVCAESLGVMNVLNDVTLEYSKTREQFGQPIGKNQAVQHRLVDMFVALEESRSLLGVYMGDVDSDDPNERSRAVSAMKIQVGRSGRLVGQEAVQLHGGIAMTDEYSASHYFKRLTVITRLFGDLDWHLDRFAGLS